MADAAHDEEYRRPPARERLEARVSAEEKALLQRAASLENRSVTDFIRSSVRAAAMETVRRHETMTLSSDDSAAFVEALMHPAEPAATLRAAVQAHRDLIGE